MGVEYMTFHEVLEELQIDEEELKRLVSNAELRGFRAGSSMKFKRDDVMNLKQGRETEPHVEEIAKELDMAPQDVLDTMLHARTVRSLDESFEQDDERSLMNILRDDNQATPDMHVMETASRNQLEEVLESLDERELRIIRLYFGLDGNESMTLEEIGGTMSLTRERVRQLKERALGKLRHPQRYQALLAICDDNEVF